LVELVPYNLVQYSETFASPWSYLSGASVSANSAVSPNGQNTAATFSVASTAFSGLLQALGSNAQSISIYAKKGTLDYLWIVNENISAIGASYNLATGAVTYTASGHTATIESVGNGWYRCIISHPTNGWEFMQFGLSNASNSATSPSGGNAYIWGAQAVDGILPKDYQRTETRLNIPRLDYSNGTCPSLLVEPQRTNLATYSEDFTNAIWLKSSATITANTTTAPDGTTTADTLTITSGGYLLQQLTLFPAVSGQSVTISVYAKNQTTDFLLFGGATAAGTDTYTITNANNGWYRHTRTRVFTTTTSLLPLQWIIFDQVGTNFIWGAQLEAGAYPTSYIPTTSASVTRNADVVSKTGISSLIGQTEGTFFVDFKLNGNSYSDNTSLYYVTLAKNSPFNFFELIRYNNSLLYFIADNGVGIGPRVLTAFGDLNGRYKFAVAYNSSGLKCFLNGVLIYTSADIIPTCDEVNFGHYDAFVNQQNNFNSVALWKTLLTDTQCIQLTTI
jgi:hypothetical protein